ACSVTKILWLKMASNFSLPLGKLRTQSILMLEVSGVTEEENNRGISLAPLLHPLPSTTPGRFVTSNGVGEHFAVGGVGTPPSASVPRDCRCNTGWMFRALTKADSSFRIAFAVASASCSATLSFLPTDNSSFRSYVGSRRD